VECGGTNCTSGENRILIRKPEAKISLRETVVIFESVEVGLKVRRLAVDVIDLAQNMYQCRTFMKIVMNFQVSETLQILLLTYGLLASEDNLFHVVI
jgi:hypothetical protein